MVMGCSVGDIIRMHYTEFRGACWLDTTCLATVSFLKALCTMSIPTVHKTNVFTYQGFPGSCPQNQEGLPPLLAAALCLVPTGKTTS